MKRLRFKDFNFIKPLQNVDKFHFLLEIHGNEHHYVGNEFAYCLIQLYDISEKTLDLVEQNVKNYRK